MAPLWLLSSRPGLSLRSPSSRSRNSNRSSRLRAGVSLLPSPLLWTRFRGCVDLLLHFQVAHQLRRTALHLNPIRIVLSAFIHLPQTLGWGWGSGAWLQAHLQVQPVQVSRRLPSPLPSQLRFRLLRCTRRCRRRGTLGLRRRQALAAGAPALALNPLGAALLAARLHPMPMPMRMPTLMPQVLLLLGCYPSRLPSHQLAW